MMKFRLLSMLLIVCAGATGTLAQVTCFAVTPSGSGAATGADWNNAKAGISGTLVRGAIYYLADGNYGNHLSLSTSASGSLVIELRKAQSYDFGSGANCTSSIGAGWSTGTMGSAQAIWRSTGTGTIVTLGSAGFYTFNGNGNNAGTLEVGCGGVQSSPPANQKGAAPNPAACGILIDDSTCTATANNGCDGGNGILNGGGANIIWESVEWFGQGLNTNGNNNSETYLWFANGGTLTNVAISHSYLHNAGTTYLTVVAGGWNSGSFDHNYVWGTFDGSVNHAEAVQLQGSNGGSGADNIHHNIFRDQQTNGDVVAVISGSQTFNFYDNVDFCSTGGTSTTCRHNDGVIGCFNTQTCAGVQIYNNTFSFPSNCGFNVSGGPSTMTYETNLFYNCGSVGMTGGTNTVDYNSYLNSAQSAVGAHDVSNNAAPNPFVSLGAGNFNLSSDNALWNNRLSLGSPYNIDLYGNTYTTDRGAAQFVSSSTPAVTLSPTSLFYGNQPIGTASQFQNVTLTNTGTATLNITSIAFTGTNASNFTLQNNTCGATLGAGLNCTMQVIFKPLVVQSYSASLTFTTNASTSPDNVTITGTAILAAPAGTPGVRIIQGSFSGTGVFQ
jgi:hypothetical protein